MNSPVFSYPGKGVAALSCGNNTNQQPSDSAFTDSDNWLKGSVEFENAQFRHLGSVATNNGYSDWATTAIPADVKTMWYRFSRRADKIRFFLTCDMLKMAIFIC